MKNYILLIIGSFIFHCNAQTPVVSLSDINYGDVNGAYYKDIPNHLNQFEGTWLYSNGSTSLTIVLEKKIMNHTIFGNYDFYEDIIVGEYRYVENGIEKINTLNNLLLSQPADEYGIMGNAIKGQNPRILHTAYIEPQRPTPTIINEMLFWRVDDGGVEKLKLVFSIKQVEPVFNNQIPQYTTYTIPFGDYILVKQP